MLDAHPFDSKGTLTVASLDLEQFDAAGNKPTGFRALMLELIECDGCGRHFATLDALGMLAAITGVCATCAGTFRLAPDSVAWPQTTVHADRVAR